MADAMDSNNSKAGTTKSKTLLGKYELGRLLGRGTFAKVYLARPVGGGDSVAVKVIDKAQVMGTAGMAPRVLREVAAMRRLRHPNVLRLHEVLATRARIYLVTELAPGGDLQSRLAARRRGLPERAVRRVFEQLVAALEYCHARGVAHRDVKPQNVLLLGGSGAGGGEVVVKVCDFGLSALVAPDSSDLLHTTCGTPAYAAPEVLLRRGAYDGAKADAWSCGVVLFVLLAGRLPFDDSNVAAMCQKALRREYDFPEWVSPPARRLVSHLLDPNPATRVAVEALATHHPWFNKRSLSLDSQLGGLLHGHPERALEFRAPPPAINAFDIISMSPGLDLSGLFGRKGNREKRFMTAASPEQTLERLDRAAGKLGYVVVGRKKGRAECLPPLGGLARAISVEMSEVAPSLMLVELRLEVADDGDDGDDGEGQIFGWEELRLELGDVVRAWNTSCQDF